MPSFLRIDNANVLNLENVQRLHRCPLSEVCPIVKKQANLDQGCQEDDALEVHYIDGDTQVFIGIDAERIWDFVVGVAHDAASPCATNASENRPGDAHERAFVVGE